MLYPLSTDSVLVLRGNRPILWLAEVVEKIVYRFAAMQVESENARIITMPTADEAEDVRCSKDGDGEAYRRLVERHQKYVGQLMWRFSRDKQVHEELVQDVFVEAYFSLGHFNERAPFGHWLARIATRVGYRYWKQAARQESAERFRVEEWDEVAEEESDGMDASKAAFLVHRLMSQLAPRDRLVLTLRYLEQCDVMETARRTGWSRVMVKVQTWRALRKLEKFLRQAEQEAAE